VYQRANDIPTRSEVTSGPQGNIQEHAEPMSSFRQIECVNPKQVKVDPDNRAKASMRLTTAEDAGDAMART